MILVSVSNRILIKPIKPVHIYFGVTGGVICKTFKIWAPGILERMLEFDVFRQRVFVSLKKILCHQFLRSFKVYLGTENWNEEKSRASFCKSGDIKVQVTLSNSLLFHSDRRNWTMLLSYLTILVTGCDKNCNSDLSWLAQSESTNTLPQEPP